MHYYDHLGSCAPRHGFNVIRTSHSPTKPHTAAPPARPQGGPGPLSPAAATAAAGSASASATARAAHFLLLRAAQQQQHEEEEGIGALDSLLRPPARSRLGQQPGGAPAERGQPGSPEHDAHTQGLR